ncbi:MAG TPA: MFS transporter [Gemmatimonadaceae bacterium]|nr:MFS transporter [Gemmatimonadaceae bacterium]
MLEKLGLHRPELRAWATYDWALSGLQTVVQTAVFPIYFVTVAASNYEPSAATQQLARANVIAMIIVAIVSPILGAIADYGATKKKFLALFTLIGALGCAGMFTISDGEIGRAMTLYVVAMIGGTGCVVFYEALLPHIARPEEMDRVSTAGYGLGYFGGGLLVALNLAWIQRPEWFGLSSADLAARLSFVSVSVWWVLFAIPLFRRVPEPPRLLETDETPGENALVVAFRRLRETLGALRGYRQAFLMLMAFLIYNDGIQTIIKMATAFGTEIGIDRGALIAAVVMVQFVGVPFAFVFGRLAGRIGAKPAIFIGLLVYAAISILGYNMRTATHFFILAFLVGMVQGGTQALSRSLFASMIPAHKSAEFFGFYSVFEKFAGVVGPLLFDLAITMTGSSRSAILSVIVFFAVGAVLLSRVNVAEGRAFAARRQRELTAGLTG